MIEYRIYTKPKSKPKAAQRLATTHYRETDAIAEAGKLALEGKWVTITKLEAPDPSRWD